MRGVRFHSSEMRRPALRRRPDEILRPSDHVPAAPPPGARVRLRVLAREDRQEFLRLARESHRLHRPWTYPPERADQFDELYGRSRREDFVCLLACRADTGEITGVFTVSQIVRGAFQSAYLGYYAHERHAGQGLMREALEQVLDHSFGPLGLHRVEANIQPGNAPSIALARGAGFRLEGFSPRYLLIGGQWRDHERYAITADERAAAKAARAA
jgi:[ribosomal protein S5]-alanine N-acetyltransferase